MPDFGDVDPDTGRTSARTQFEGTLDPLAPSVANGQITPAQWAEYQAKRRRDAILGTFLTLGGMLGAQPLANAMGIGSAGAGSVTGGGEAVGAAYPGAGLFGAPATPVAASGAASGSAAAGAGAGALKIPGYTPGWEGNTNIIGAGSGAAKTILGMAPRDLAALGLGVGSTVGGAISGRNQNTAPTTATSDPNLQALMQAMQRRLDKSEPLYDSVLAMANGLLPTQYQKGGGGMG
jgi:hypothetical protein